MQHAPSTRTTAWTEVATPFTAAAVLAASLAGAAALTGSLPVLAAAVLLVAGTTMVAGRANALGGGLTGLVAAACAILVADRSQAWSTASRALDVCLVAALVLLGVSTAMCGQRVRRIHRDADRAAQGVVRPVAGTLGTLRHDDGLQLLDAEMLRARVHGRPLALAVITLEPAQRGLSDEHTRRARRAFLRSLVAELRPTDIPFVTDEGELGVIMPETYAQACGDTVTSSVLGAAHVTFADREQAERVEVGEALATSVRIAAMPPDHGSPEAFLAAARAAHPCLDADVAAQPGTSAP